MKAKEFIKDCTRGCSNELCAVEDRYGKKVISYHEWLTPEQALSAVELAKEELLDKVCEWLDKNMFTYMSLMIYYNVHNEVVCDMDRMLQNLRRAMK